MARVDTSAPVSVRDYHILALDVSLHCVHFYIFTSCKCFFKGRAVIATEDRRVVRGEHTRAAAFAATRAILESEGFEALTMAAVAARAGVSRRALYNHFASRGELVAALFDFMAESEGLADSVRPMREAPNAAAALDEWARHLARYHPRLLAIDRAVARVREMDEDAARHWERVKREKYANCRFLAERLERERQLSPEWTSESAADMLYALISSDVVEALLHDRRWSAKRFAEQLAVLLRATFLRRPPAGSARKREGR
jgi:AcrR family transcriptional regulator